jgi:hypothetical protein
MTVTDSVALVIPRSFAAQIANLIKGDLVMTKSSRHPKDHIAERAAHYHQQLQHWKQPQQWIICQRHSSFR